MVIQANANISTYTSKVNQNIQGKTVSHKNIAAIRRLYVLQGGSNMTGTGLCVNKPHCAAAVRP